MEDFGFVETLHNKGLSFCESFDADVDIANLHV